MTAQSVLGAGSTYENSLLFQLIEENCVTPWVSALSPAFRQLEGIVEAVTGGRFNNAESEASRENGARLLKIPYLPDNTVTATINTRTVVSSTILRLTFNQSGYNGFINYQSVKGSNGTWGQVKDHGPGFVVLELLYSITGDTTFQTADFAATTDISARQDVSPGVTGGRENIEETPLLTYNVIQQQRYSYTITRENISRRTAIKASDGTYYWEHQGFSLAMQRNKNVMNMGMWDSPMLNVQDRWMSGGIEWQIKNQGNGTLPPYQGQFTPEVLLQVAGAAKAKGLTTQEFLVPIGFNALSTFQNSNWDNQLKFSGTSNTIGGVDVKGMNAKVFTALDIDFKMVSWPMLNSRRINPSGDSVLQPGQLKSSYTAVFLNTEEVDTVNYGKQPFISKYSYGADPYNMQKLDGITDILGRKSKSPTNDINAASVQLEVNNMYQLNNPDNHFILEIAS